MLKWPDFPALSLDPVDFDSQLEKDGVDTLIRRGIACSCYDDETRQPAPTCPACDGWGMLYDPDDEVTTKVLWTSHRSEVSYQTGGTIKHGSTRVTWASTIPLGHGAMFVSPLEETVTDNELLKRGETDPEGNTLERLRYRNVVAVEVVRTAAQKYVEGVDFNMVGQEIQWITPGPAAGTLYAVRYRHKTHFVIDQDDPQMREDVGKRLAYTCNVRRFPSLNRQSGDALGQG